MSMDDRCGADRKHQFETARSAETEPTNGRPRLRWTYAPLVALAIIWIEFDAEIADFVFFTPLRWPGTIFLLIVVNIFGR